MLSMYPELCKQFHSCVVDSDGDELPRHFVEQTHLLERIYRVLRNREHYYDGCSTLLP